MGFVLRNEAKCCPWSAASVPSTAVQILGPSQAAVGFAERGDLAAFCIAFLFRWRTVFGENHYPSDLLSGLRPPFAAGLLSRVAENPGVERLRSILRRHKGPIHCRHSSLTKSN